VAGGPSGNCITRQRTWYARNDNKNAQYPTHTVAATTNDLIRDVNVLDGIALDYEIGGFNTMAVKAGRPGSLDANILREKELSGMVAFI